MINTIYRLVSPRQFEITYKNKSINDENIVIRPTHMSICAADQRYYTGTRGKEAMREKLPMALIHEAVGEVVYDYSNEFEIGSKVVMVPNIPVETDEVVSENYLRSSHFRSSGFDGFMQDYIFTDKSRVVLLPNEINLDVAAFTELATIATHAIARMNSKSHQRKNTIGVWGDGNLGYITSLFLKKIFPNSEVLIFGKTDYKLNHFSFVDEIYKIDDLPKDLFIDHAIECVGGKGSQSAINQAIDIINPEGTISMLGVSEYHVEINTRMVLEKGLTLIGSSRSGVKDFEDTVEIYKKHPEVMRYLSTLIGESFKVRSIDDIINAFEYDLSSSWGKTVMRWDI